MTATKRDWKADERAVSPVIGVILMVAITVILAAVIGTFVLDLGQSAGDSAPQASLSVSVNTNTNNTTVSHTGGDGIDAGETRVIFTNGSGGEVIYEPATQTGDVLSVGGSVEFGLNETDVVDETWSGMESDDDGFAVESGDQITVTLIDTASQRQIFESTVTA